MKYLATNMVTTTDFNAAPIMLSDLQAFVPSITATEAHHSRSDKYGFISTMDILMGLRDRFAIVKAQQSRVRKDGTRQAYTKHLVRLRARNVPGVQELGGIFPELVLVNSHDGSGSYQLHAGLFRLICLNGMVVCEENHGRVRLRHNANAVDEVIDASYAVIDQSLLAIQRAGEWSRIETSRDERMAFAEAVHALRFEPGTDAAKAIPADRLLAPRRMADSRDDLWSVVNRVQENAIKGGLVGFGPVRNGRRGRMSTARAVTGVDQDVKLNRAIWAFAEKLAAIHA
jgi:hypothetical protein